MPYTSVGARMVWFLSSYSWTFDADLQLYCMSGQDLDIYFVLLGCSVFFYWSETHHSLFSCKWIITIIFHSQTKFVHHLHSLSNASAELHLPSC